MCVQVQLLEKRVTSQKNTVLRAAYTNNYMTRHPVLFIYYRFYIVVHLLCFYE